MRRIETQSLRTQIRTEPLRRLLQTNRSQWPEGLSDEGEKMKTIRIACRGAEAVQWDKLVPFQGALKTLSEENYQKFKAEILRDGFAEPISVWKREKPFHDLTYVVLNGHQRLATIRRMVTEEGYSVPALPVSIVYVQDEKQANELVLALTAQYGEMTNESLAAFLIERNLPVRETLERFPHRDVNADKVLRLVENPVKEGDDEKADEAPPVPVDPRVSLGDVFKCGEHLIVCGDSALKPSYWALGLGLESDVRADLVVTDPPYNLASEAPMHAVSELRVDSYGRLQDSDWDKGFNPDEAIKLLLLFSTPTASFYVFTSHFLFDRIYRALKESCEYASYCVWSKSNPMPSLAKRHWAWNTELVAYGARKDHVFNYPEQGNALSTWNLSKITKAEFHPTQKPVAVIEHPILHSSKPGAIVLDAFGGSGTTMIACERTGRKARLIELSPAYVRVTIDRWEKLTGKKAEKVS